MKKRPHNVVRDGHEDAAPPDRHRILIGVQDAARSMLVKLLGDVFETIHNEIGSAAGSTHTHGVRTAITRRAKITRAALDRLDRFWADFALGIALPAGGDLLSGDVAHLADKARGTSRPAYDRLAKRLVELHLHAAVEIDYIPLDPAYLALTFREALEECGIDASSVLAMMSAFDLEVLQRLDELYDTLNHFLAGCGILADEPVPEMDVDRRPARAKRRAEFAPPSHNQAAISAADQSTMGDTEPATPERALESAAAMLPVPDTHSTFAPHATEISEPPVLTAVTMTTEEQALSKALLASTGSSPGGEAASSSTSYSVPPGAGEEGHHEASAAPEATQSTQGLSRGQDVALPIGSWVTLHIGGGPSVRAKLSWRSPHGKMLFVDAQGKKVAQLSEEETQQALRARS